MHVLTMELKVRILTVESQSFGMQRGEERENSVNKGGGRTARAVQRKAPN